MMFGLVLAFVHWGYVYLFHCIIIEHIPEYLVRWHSVSHVDYYLTLGHTPILEFIGSSADFLTAHSIAWPLWVVTLGHTPILESTRSFVIFSHHLIHFLIFVSRYTGAYPFGAFLLGHTPSLWVYRVSCWFHGCWTHLLIFTSYHLGHSPTVSLFRASPYHQFV